MKIIIFGGSGFLGSHVADVLDGMGHKVVIYDIKSSPYLKPSQKMIVGNILDEKKVEKSIQGCGIVYNFAGITNIEVAKNNPLDTVRFNILGNTVILEACVKFKVKRFVYASSLYVYGKAGGFYRSSKQACELLIENYHDIFGLPYTILRYGSLYGPRSEKDNFIHKIIKQALTEGKITRYGDGNEIREYIHVLDGAKGSIEILSEEFKNQEIIITGNQQTRISDLLLMIKEMLDSKIKIEFLPPKDNSHYEITPYSFAPRIAKRLNNRTYLDLNQGILDLIYNFHKELNAETKEKSSSRKKQ